MNEVQLFQFHEVEVQMIRGEGGEPLFRAKHVCEAIGLTNPRRSCRRISEEFKERTKVSSPGGQQTVLFLREAGVWELLATARLHKDNPNAEKIQVFRSWLFGQVLPEVRRTGGYNPEPKALNLAPFADEIEATIRIAKLFGLEGNQALLSTAGRMKREFGIDLMGSLQLALPSPDNKVRRTATQIGTACFERSGAKLSPQKVNQRLFEAGWQVSHPSGKGWLPTELGKVNGGLMVDTGKSHGRGKPVQQLEWLGDEAIELCCQAQPVAS